MATSPTRLLNGKSVSRETESRLQQFGLLFQKWAKTINLVAPSTIQDLWSRHIADSAQLFQLNPKPGIWLDLGSGGGFPGIITAIFLAENAGSCVHLVESNHKKAAFLRTALREAGAPGTVHPVRIEDAPALIPHVDFVSARALAELDPLLGYIHPWAEKNPLLKAYLHKGRDYLREVEISNRRWQFDLVRHDSVVEADSVILEIDNLRKKSDNRG